jgi:hypothetical protein
MTIVLLLSGLVVIFLSSIVVLIPNGQFLGCAILCDIQCGGYTIIKRKNYGRNELACNDSGNER